MGQAECRVDPPQELAATAADDQGPCASDGAVGFSVRYNPLLLRDPYAAEVANLAEAYLPRAGANADAIRRIIALYRKPEAQRRGMSPDDIAEALDPARPGSNQKPDQEHDHTEPGSIAKRILRLPADQRAAREPALIAEMEAAARDSGGWGRLGLGYLDLGQDAVRAGDRARADRYVDRLLAILREHPEFQDPARGNVDAVSPTALAAFFIRAGRRDQWDAFLKRQPDAIRADLAIGEVGDLGLAGKFDSARAVIDHPIYSRSDPTRHRGWRSQRGARSSCRRRAARVRASPTLRPRRVGSGRCKNTSPEGTPPEARSRSPGRC